MDNITTLLTFDAHLRKKLLAQVGKLGFVTDEKGYLAPRSEGKKALRTLHSFKRNALLEREREFVQSEWPRLRRYFANRSEEHTSELQSHSDLVCRLLLEKKNK